MKELAPTRGGWVKVDTSLLWPEVLPNIPGNLAIMNSEMLNVTGENLRNTQNCLKTHRPMLN